MNCMFWWWNIWKFFASRRFLYRRHDSFLHIILILSILDSTSPTRFIPSYLAFKMFTSCICGPSVNRATDVARPSEVRTCRFWRLQGRDNSQGGTQKHRILLCTSDSWEAGSQACGAPRSLLLRAPITLRHAYPHTHAHGHLHTILLLDKERDGTPLNLPANSHTCTYIGQTTQRN